MYKKGFYWLFHNQPVDAEYSYKNHIQMAWFIVRYSQAKEFGSTQDFENNRFFVEEGDIIKFGRVRFKIRKLKILDTDSSEENYSRSQSMDQDGIGIIEPTVEDGLN